MHLHVKFRSSCENGDFPWTGHRDTHLHSPASGDARHLEQEELCLNLVVNSGLVLSPSGHYTIKSK